MKTIEERAYSRYAENGCPRDCGKCEMRTDCTDVDYVWAFIDGAQSEHEELTRWHSEIEHPECGKSVLIKCKSGSTGKVFYVVGYHSGYEWCDKGVLITHYDSVVGWREIHE